MYPILSYNDVVVASSDALQHLSSAAMGLTLSDGYPPSDSNSHLLFKRAEANLTTVPAGSIPSNGDVRSFEVKTSGSATNPGGPADIAAQSVTFISRPSDTSGKERAHVKDPNLILPTADQAALQANRAALDSLETLLQQLPPSMPELNPSTPALLHANLLVRRAVAPEWKTQHVLYADGHLIITSPDSHANVSI